MNESSSESNAALVAADLADAIAVLVRAALYHQYQLLFSSV